jgi:hypothetical protein
MYEYPGCVGCRLYLGSGIERAILEEVRDCFPLLSLISQGNWMSLSSCYEYQRSTLIGSRRDGFALHLRDGS